MSYGPKVRLTLSCRGCDLLQHRSETIEDDVDTTHYYHCANTADGLPFHIDDPSNTPVLHCPYAPNVFESVRRSVNGEKASGT